MVFIDEEATRLKKVEELREAGIEPYPSRSERTHDAHIFLERFHDLEEKKTQATLCGRIVLLRRQGGLTFARLQDASGAVQLVLRKDEIGDELYDLFCNNVDRGDFVQVTGTAFTTKRGESSLFVSSWRLLVKSIKPLPEKWHGLKDKEERFRKRYLDILMNDEVRQRFIARARIVQEIRNYFDGQGYLEVEPPALQPVYGGGFARPFKTHHNALDFDLYLPISNEMYLKRLLVGGFEKVYAITKAFRNEGVDQDHNPEFTMLEAQTAFSDYRGGMDLIENVFEHVALKVHGTTELHFQGEILSVKRPWPRLRMVDAVEQATGIAVNAWKNVETAKKEIIKKCTLTDKAHGELDSLGSIGELIAFLFEQTVEETLMQPTIIYDFPIEISPLAKKCADDPRFTERFEYFAFGSEIGNNYTELNDPADLRKRFIEEKKRGEAGFDEAHQFDQDYLDAIAHGMPPNCGISIGIDRMVMLYTDTASIKEVILFPTMKPEQSGGDV